MHVLAMSNVRQDYRFLPIISSCMQLQQHGTSATQSMISPTPTNLQEAAESISALSTRLQVSKNTINTVQHFTILTIHNGVVIDLLLQIAVQFALLFCNLKLSEIVYLLSDYGMCHPISRSNPPG